jgi:Tol biopolymer transport system component/DNA-binding winged helix-turn-helix (wHTH) protein
VLEPVSNSQVVRFGTYELDVRLAELRKNGIRIKLSGQPFQILVVLVGHPGELVTREQLQRQLWPSDTFVDFDRGLNAAINRVREALGDSAENPRFVETIPRKGYRFVAPVNGANGISPAHGPEAEAEPGRKVPRRSEHPLPIGFLPYIAAGIIFVVLIAAVGWWRNSGKVPQITRYSQITADGQGKSSGYASEPPTPLISDGARLYFLEGPVGTKHLVQVSAQGGETSLLPSLFGVRRVLDFSPERHELLVSAAGERLERETPLMILPLPAGPPHRAGNILGHDGRWSPDGTRIVYAEGHSLFVADSNGNGVRKLVDLPGTAWWPRWSPEGKTIRFTVLPDLGSQNPLQEIWEVQADGSHLRRAFADLAVPAIQCCGNWTANGKYYVFSSPDFFRGQLWALREHPGIVGGPKKVFRLSSGPMSMTSALPSADNKLFAIAQHQRGQLVRYDRQAGQFLPFLKGISATDVDISKDGQWVVYVSFPDGALWRSRIDGSQQLQLTLPPMQVALPRWSPDGNRIAFVGDDHIYLVPRDGGAPESAGRSTPLKGEPTWSPDGRFLAFAPWFWLDGKSGISILDLKTGTVKAMPGSEGLFSPRYSPDGKYLAALTTEASTLVLIDLKTGAFQKLCDDVAYPNWSRDGYYINFDKPYQENTGLYRVHISDGKVEKVASLEPSFLSWAIVGKWTALASDDSPLVLRDTSVDEIYALDWDTQ